MMDADIRRQIDQIHGNRTMAVIVMTGGGGQALKWLLSTPGASRTVLEVQVPYASSSLAKFLGYEPQKAVDAVTTKDMARIAFERACQLADTDVEVVGIGCTAALTTDRVKRGEHRCFVAECTKDASTVYGITFKKGLRDRDEEDEIVSRLVLWALANASGLEATVPLGLVDDEHLTNV